jgi:signal transduction histidine kinase
VNAARIVGVYTAVAVLFTGQVWLDYAYLRVPVSWPLALGVSAIDWYLWAALTPAVLALARRFPLARGRLARALALHVPASVVLTAFKLPLQEALGALLLGIARQPTSFLKIYVGLFTYWAIVGVAMAVRQYREARERELRASALEADLARAQLDALRMRLNPHFLFNTLNGISALMHEDVEAADLMLTRLCELLRMTLDRGSVQEVTLKDELDFVRRYLEIQQLRFGDRLAVTIDAPAETLSLSVPSLSLQPLVENALKHGAERTPGPASLGITARIAASRLHIDVADDGPGPSGDGRAGTGLDTTRLRLRHLYGDAGSLTLESRSPRGALARLTIPAREPPA